MSRAETLALVDAPPIAGLRFRHYAGPGDHAQMLRVYNAAHEADGLEDVSTVEQFDLNYSTLVNCDPTRDMLLAEVDGQVVAYARVYWTDQVDGSRSYENFGFIDPAWRRRGIGGAMHRRNEQRLREIAAGHPEVGTKWFSSEGMEAAVGNAVLLARSGYTPVRYFYDMVAPTLEGITPPPMPEGIEVRPVSTDHFRAIWDASAEAFRDHWGEPEATQADWERFRDNPEHVERPFWMIGWDGDEVAAVVTTTVPKEENRERGRKRVWVESVSTRRRWRRRGLAKALLARSLVAAREAGFPSAGLGVDAENPTGALGLYESLGFAAERTGIAYRKPFGS